MQPREVGLKLGGLLVVDRLDWSTVWTVRSVSHDVDAITDSACFCDSQLTAS